MLTARWRQRLLLARLERVRLGWLAPALAPLARSRGEHAFRVTRRLVRRQGLALRIVLAAAMAALGWLLALALLAVLRGQIAAHLT